MKEQLPFYSFERMYSYNAVFNFCVGGRGLGKTYGKKKKSIHDAIHKGRQFIYLRRYKDELATARSTFFADVAEEFPNHMFRIANGEAQCAKNVVPVPNKKGEMVEPKPRWFTIGFFVVLATAQHRKSVSYHRVRTIIFDEFIIEKGLIRYLPDEVTALLQFYNTVDRNRNETKVYFLANSVTMMNPYFDEYDIKPDQCGEWSVYAVDKKFGAFIVVHFPDAKDFQDAIYKTRFGRFMKDYASDYADFAVGNEFPDTHDALVVGKPERARYRWTFETKSIIFTVWKDRDTGHYFVQRKRPKGHETIFITDRSKMEVGKTYVEQNNPILQGLRRSFDNALIYFDEPKTRNGFTEAIKR